MESADGFDSLAKESDENGHKIQSQKLDEIKTNSVFVYRDDAVTCGTHQGLLGIVTEVSGDTESDDSSTDDSDSEDDGDTAGGGDGGGGGGGGGDDDDNDNGDVDNGEEYDSLPEGQVRITWTDGTDSIENTSDVIVVDRGFLHGDIVSSASDPTGQLGLVVDVTITADLLSANGELIKNVTSRDLRRVREPLVGDFAVLGSWLGRIDDVLDNVTVLFDDGSICKVAKADPLRLKPLSRPVVDSASSSYYPGQRVRAVSSSVFKSSRWLSGLWKANRLEGSVIRVEAASVVVYWIASAFFGVGTNSETVPSEDQDPRNLTLLSCFSYANWQLGDWCHLLCPQVTSSSSLYENSNNEVPMEHSGQPLDDSNLVIGDHRTSEGPNQDAAVQNLDLNLHCDHQMTDGDKSNGTDLNNAMQDSSSWVGSPSSAKEQTGNETWPSYRKKIRKVFFKREKRTRRKDETFERSLFVVNTVTKVDVAWQDGSREYGLESKTLIPIHTPSDHEFFPEQYVVEKASSDDDESFQMQRLGIVRNVNSKERTVCIRWLKPVSRPEDPREFDSDELVSAYELEEHPDYDYCYGDVVVRLSPVSVPADEAEGHDDAMEADKAGKNFTSLSWVGHITGLQDGDIEVTWADGMVSKVGPQAIFVVGREDDSVDGGSDVSDVASWETFDENEETVENAEREADPRSPTINTIEKGTQTEATPEGDDNAGTRGSLSMPLAALGFVTRFAVGLFSRGKTGSDQPEEDHISNERSPVSDERASDDELSSEGSDALNDPSAQDAPETNVTHADVAATEDADVAATEDADVALMERNTIGEEADSDDYSSFKHFDIEDNPEDHHFLGTGEHNTGGRKWVKKIQQEWSILEKNLPDDVYVRVFEDRMDLLRTVIVGACGTPYQDGLFFFDFHLTPEYPQVPPSAYYHSGGLRVNPNLYVDGKVCLSLLNTWAGKGNEVWDPSSSSILQVLVSLQGLVLNSKPYFNEAGYEKQVGTVEGEKNSLPYNENTYLLNLKSMLYLLRRPPMHFEVFVKDHFRTRGTYILRACEAYAQGSTIASLTKDACLTEKSGEHRTSVGFKLILKKIMPKLIEALTELGVDCNQFEYLMK